MEPKTIDISVFFDGTKNSEKEPFPTNVFKLYSYVITPDDNSHKKYCPGPGGSEYDVFLGGLIGVGIWENVKEVYRWFFRQVSSLNETRREYRTFIFGFSRGAYTAHLFSWLLSVCGIPKNIEDCDHTVDMFREYLDSVWSHIDKTDYETIDAIELVGLWDNVKSIKPDRNYYDAQLPSIVKNAYHAMSLDELRRHFPVLKWNKADNVRQVWFQGVHSDVGGGYEESGLSDIALDWMYCNALKHGLSMNELEVNPEAKSIIHDPFREDFHWNLIPSPTKERTFEKGELVISDVAKKISQEYFPKAINYPKLPEKPEYVSA